MILFFGIIVFPICHISIEAESTVSGWMILFSGLVDIIYPRGWLHVNSYTIVGMHFVLYEFSEKSRRRREEEEEEEEEQHRCMNDTWTSLCYHLGP